MCSRRVYMRRVYDVNTLLVYTTCESGVGIRRVYITCVYNVCMRLVYMTCVHETSAGSGPEPPMFEPQYITMEPADAADWSLDCTTQVRSFRRLHHRARCQLVRCWVTRYGLLPVRHWGGTPAGQRFPSRGTSLLGPKGEFSVIGPCLGVVAPPSSSSRGTRLLISRLGLPARQCSLDAPRNYPLGFPSDSGSLLVSWIVIVDLPCEREGSNKRLV